MKTKLSKSFALFLTAVMLATQTIVPSFADPAVCNHLALGEVGSTGTYLDSYVATCTDAAYDLYNCSVCEQNYAIITGAALNHYRMEEHAFELSTCVENGYVAHSYCPDCDTYFVNGVEADYDTEIKLPLSTSHNWVVDTAYDPGVGRSAVNGVVAPIC